MLRKTFVAHLVFAALAALAAGGCTQEEAPPAIAGACPVWAADPLDLHSNEVATGLGCANQVNFRSMIDRPADLQAGRSLGPTPAIRQAEVVEAYQHGKVPALRPDQPTPTIIMPGGQGGQGGAQ